MTLLFLLFNNIFLYINHATQNFSFPGHPAQSTCDVGSIIFTWGGDWTLMAKERRQRKYS